jgi:hypothetical protein
MDGLETFVAFQVATSCKLLTFITYRGMAEGESFFAKKYQRVIFIYRFFSPSAIPPKVRHVRSLQEVATWKATNVSRPSIDL